MTEYKPDVDEALERFLQQRKAMLESATQSMRSFMEILLPAFEAFDKALHAMHARYWEEYLAAGAPYDRTEEGFDRWLDELTGRAEIEAAIEEAQEREEHRCWLKQLAQRFRKTEDADGTAQTD